MARKKQEEGKKGLDEWMATYSDMVTLLMCFFVLLYASSTPDATKFQYIFQAFNTSGTYINPFVLDKDETAQESVSDEDGNSDTPPYMGDGDSLNSDSASSMPSNFDQLFAWFSQQVADSDMSESVSVSQTSASRIYIRFDNSIMFEGDSAVLLDSGKKAIDLLTPGLKMINEYIKTVKVSGHTADGISLVNDWDLSSARACSVIKYMDFKVVVDSDKYIAEGRAQYDPIADNTTEEGRAENRRVELVIVRNDISPSDTAIIGDILKYDYGINNIQTDPDDRTNAGTGNYDDAKQQIIDSLNDRYSGVSINEDGTVNDFTGPSQGNGITEIPESALHELDADGNIILTDEEIAAAQTTAAETDAPAQ